MRKRVCVLLLLFAGFVLSARAYQDAPAKATDAAKATDPNSGNTKPETTAKDNAGHNWHLRLGTIGVGAAYYNGPAFYPYPYYGYPGFYSAAYWDPLWDPFWGPGYSGYALNFAYGHGKGEVKLSGAPKDAKVYVDGAYAGTAKDLKHVWLDPGAYDLSVVSPGRDTFQQRIYVLSGKTLKIVADQRPKVSD